jgi:hypothetical protein
MGGIRPSTTIRHIGGKRRIREFAHLLGFVKPVDLIKEYNRLSIYPGVRSVADMKTVCRPSGEFAKVLGFLKSLA